MFSNLPESPMIEPVSFAEHAPHDPAALYLDLIKRSLVSWIYPDWPDAPAGGQPSAAGGLRDEGKDWPTQAHTMIGIKRLNSLHECVEAVLRDNVPGDVLEAGVWRGGAAVLMRAVLQVRGATNRRVWVADSFAGLPRPNLKQYPQDAWLAAEYPQLAVSLEQVQENFRRYGLLDNQVRFLKGWFKDTLPTAPIEQLAVLRLDGDLYESTMDVLTNLYDKLAPGGFLIVDDYGAIPACAQAVQDFRHQRKIDDPIVPIDWTGVYWRKGTQFSALVNRAWAIPDVPDAGTDAMSLPAVLQPPMLYPEDWNEALPRPTIGSGVEDLRRQYRGHDQRKPAPVAVASLVFERAAYDDHLSRTLAHQDVDCEIMVEDNHDNHTTLARFYNQVIDTARHDRILFCHPDIEFSPWGVSALLATLENVSDCGAVGVVGVTLQGLAAWSDRRRLPREVSTLDSCLVMIDRRHGLRFDENTFSTFHCVVEDYCLQVQDRGRKVYVGPGVTAAHFGATTFEKPAQTMAWINEALHFVSRLQAKWPRIPFCTTSGFDTNTQQMRNAYYRVKDLLQGLQQSRTLRVGKLVTMPARALRQVARRAGVPTALARIRRRA